MHRDMFKIQDGVAIVEKLNSDGTCSKHFEAGSSEECQGRILHICNSHARCLSLPLYCGFKR